MNEIEIKAGIDKWWDDLSDNWLAVLEIISNFAPKEIEQAIVLKSNSDKELWYCIQTAWDNSPDEEWVRNMPSWDKFIDICATGWVLFEPCSDEQEIGN